MPKDTKTMWIWVLVIALVVVGTLYVFELQKPDSVADFNNEAAGLQTKISAGCKDMTTDGGRENCAEALKKMRDLLDEFFPKQ